MLVSDVKRRVKRLFGDESGTQLKDADIVDWINDAQREIYSKNNLGMKVGTLPTIVGTREYSLPVDLMRLFNVKYDGDTLSSLTQQDVDQFLPNDDGDSTARGRVVAYYTYADKIELYPAPDSVKNLTIRYNRYPTDVVADGDSTDVDKKYENRIVDYCMAQANQLDGNMQAYVMLMQRFEGKTDSTKEDETERQANDFYSSISVSARDSDYSEWGYV